MNYINEDKINRNYIEKNKLNRNDRAEIKEMAREAAQFVTKGGDPRDLPKALRIDN